MEAVYLYPDDKSRSQAPRDDGNFVLKTLMHFSRKESILYFVLILRIPETNWMSVAKSASGISLSKWNGSYNALITSVKSARSSLKRTT